MMLMTYDLQDLRYVARVILSELRWPKEQEELQKLDRDDFSGFSSDPDGSSASLCYTSSSGDKDASGRFREGCLGPHPVSASLPGSGFSFLVGTDGAAQTDPTLGKADAWA